MPDVRNITAKLDRIYQLTGNYNVFSDWIDIMLCVLISDRTSEHPYEKRYMEIVKRYGHHKDVITLFGEAFYEAMKAMKESGTEVLGLIYMQVVSSWKNKSLGQYFTPPHIAEMMATMSGGVEAGQLVGDPTCGSGVMLVSYNKISPDAVFIGQDLDLICTKMTALNMCFFNMEGYSLNGDTLRSQVLSGFKSIKSPFGGSLRELTEQECKDMQECLKFKAKEKDESVVVEDMKIPKLQQLNLFNTSNVAIETIR